jgi:hypothetical protein
VGSDQRIQQLQHLYSAEPLLALLQVARQGNTVEEVVGQQQQVATALGAAGSGFGAASGIANSYANYLKGT